MEQSQIRSAFVKWNEMHQRNAWRVSIDNANADSLSWFGGSPTAADDLPWPACSQCKKAMQFFLQLDLSSLPSEFETSLRDGVLQLFYCSTDDGNCDTWEAFSGTHEIRIIPRAEEACSHPTAMPFAKSVISSWQRVTDSPSPEEHETLGIEYDYDFEKNNVSVEVAEFGITLINLDIDLNVAETISKPSLGDKLGGWPAWAQGPEYPACPVCQRQMGLLFQVDSNDNLDYMFGDVGCGHITQCREHPTTLAFAWACG